MPTAHTHTVIAQAGVAAGSEPKDCVIKPSVFKSTLQEVGKQMELSSTEINKLMHMTSHDRHAFLRPLETTLPVTQHHFVTHLT